VVVQFDLPNGRSFRDVTENQIGNQRAHFARGSDAPFFDIR
jgi:hypothetical protein